MNKKEKLIMSAEDYIEEYVKCKNDFVYFCANYVYLELPGGDVLFKLYEPQKELIKAYKKKKNIVVLKSRQIGISTVTQAYCAWLAVFYDNCVIGVVSKDAPEATDFARYIRGIIEKLPRWMLPKGGLQGPGFAKKSERSFIMTNGAKVWVSPVAPTAPEKCLRGKAITFLVIDEAAFIKFMDDAWTAMVPALSTAQKHAREAGVPYGTVVLSTPNKTVGVGKWFYENYMRAVNKDPDDPFAFTSHEIHWKHVKELAEDPAWYKQQCSLFNNDPKKIKQELEMTFLPASGSFFDQDTASRMQDSCIDPIAITKTHGGEIWRFEDHIPGRGYLMGVDTASEYGKDFSAITIWDYETLNLVWEYQGKCSVTKFVEVVKLATASYPSSTVVVESTGGYRNQVLETLNGTSLSNNLYKEIDKSRVKPGVTTTSKTRPLMIESLYTYMTEFPEIVKSKRLYLELIGLIEKSNGRVEADVGCNDDLALSAAFAFYIRRYQASSYSMMFKNNPESRENFSDVMEMNDGVASGGFNNDDILDEIKRKMDEDLANGNESQAFIDILSLYGRG